MMFEHLAWRRSDRRKLWRSGASRTARVVHDDQREAFVGFRSSSGRSFFPHRMRFLRKAGPDAMLLARRMARIRSPSALWEIVIHAEEPAVDGVPRALFFDPEVTWHQQHLGQPRHVAYACVALRGRTLFGLNYVSDVAQRVSRRPAHRSKVENALSGWPDLVLNAILHFAVETNCREFRSPTADFVIEHTDPARTVGRELFERVYDRTVSGTLTARRTPRWWITDVRQNAEHRLRAEIVEEPSGESRRICIFHDVERGLGHRRSDPEFAQRADRTSPGALTEMLDVERELEVSATYMVVGKLLPEVREDVEEDGHCLAFHSFDHDPGRGQLEPCREVDYRLPGYHPPKSRLTPELSDHALTRKNFQWLALSVHDLDESVPYLENRVVKIPVLTDDFRLYRDGLSADRWAEEIVSLASEREFSAIGLHDCYGELWLPTYRQLLESLRAVGELTTFDAIANEVFLQTSI